MGMGQGWQAEQRMITYHPWVINVNALAKAAWKCSKYHWITRLARWFLRESSRRYSTFPPRTIVIVGNPYQGRTVLSSMACQPSGSNARARTSRRFCSLCSHFPFYSSPCTCSRPIDWCLAISLSTYPASVFPQLRTYTEMSFQALDSLIRQDTSLLPRESGDSIRSRFKQARKDATTRKWRRLTRRVFGADNPDTWQSWPTWHLCEKTPAVKSKLEALKRNLYNHRSVP
jgi:hypothetical protein